ncbi:MAG: dihydroorotate dehydrogenase [Clostridiales bacterium]|nr:dihydroorotate dehydrogenase [Clostridiales bacterium]
MSELSVRFAGIPFKNPVTVASGTFAFGREYVDFFDLSRLGGIAVKGLTYTERQGNRPPRIAETPMGMLNSIGLQNPGYRAFIETELPWLRRFDTVLIANITGATPREYAEMAEALGGAGLDLIEINVSCPNVKEGGALFGASAGGITEVVTACRRATDAKLMVKLSPNVTDIAEMAKAAEAAGADALSLINTLLGMRIDIATRRPILGNNLGGLSGPAVRPVAVRMVYQVAQAVRLPILGMGGIATADDALEFLLAGATAVAVGTATIVDPLAPIRVLEGLERHLHSTGESVGDIIGAVQMN